MEDSKTESLVLSDDTESIENFVDDNTKVETQSETVVVQNDTYVEQLDDIYTSLVLLIIMVGIVGGILLGKILWERVK